MSLESIYKKIEQDNQNHHCMTFIPFFECVSDETIMQLINDGFKVSKGEMFRGDKGLIIEW